MNMNTCIYIFLALDTYDQIVSLKVTLEHICTMCVLLKRNKVFVLNLSAIIWAATLNQWVLPLPRPMLTIKHGSLKGNGSDGPETIEAHWQQ